MAYPITHTLKAIIFTTSATATATAYAVARAVVTVLASVAGAIIVADDIETYVVILVTPFARTRISAGLTVSPLIAGLDSVAVQTVVTTRVIRSVCACVCALVTRIVGAPHTVIAIRRRSSLTRAVHASLRSVAEQAVIAIGVERAGFFATKGVDLDVVNVPPAVCPILVGITHGPAQENGGLIIGYR
jgi:hypothetical protein